MTLPRLTFEKILPLLVSTYMQGRLVPFLGAGMSAGRLALWGEFVENLENEADKVSRESGLVKGALHFSGYGTVQEPSKTGLSGPYDVARSVKMNHGVLTSPGESLKLSNDVRAQRACTRIRNSRGRACFLDSIRKALIHKGALQEMPLQTTNLASIRWPLVVSTNYDDLYFGACQCPRPGKDDPPSEMDVQVLGRSPKDCKLVLSSLHGPFDRPYIWHVQGFLGGQLNWPPGDEIEKKVPGLEDLREQLVVGHAEYRLVTNASPHFRRCFGEMFNSRSFLFLGSSLTEEYFLNLFGEVLDLCGPSHVPHFALTKKGTVNAHFLADQMNITVCEFDDYKDLPDYLQRLQSAIANPQARNTGWSFAVGSGRSAKGDLNIVRDDVPVPLGPGSDEVIALVARRNALNRPLLQQQYADLDQKYPYLCPIGKHVLKYGDAEIYAVTARCSGDEDDSAVDAAVRELLNEIDRRAREQHEERKAVHLQLSPNRGTVPPVFAFMQVVQAFGRWIRGRNNECGPLRLILHIQSDVEFNLTSGRIDVQELLSSKLIRFWAIVSSDANKEPVRRVLHYAGETPLSVVLDDLGVPFSERLAEWSVSVCPSPRRAPENGVKNTTLFLHDLFHDHVHDHGQEPTLFSIGVVFGSVLTLECVGGKDCPIKPAAEH